MSDTIRILAAQLADDTLKAQKEFGEDRLFVEVSQVIGAASQTLEEAFLTEIRVRMAEEKAREFLAVRLNGLRKARDAAAEPAPPGPAPTAGTD